MTTMPRIKRWFPVSHDVNADPEVLELTDRFGLSGLKVWLEILSISDRNDGVVSGVSESIVRALSIKCNTTQRQVRAILEFIQSKLWISSELPIRVRNYSKYHRSREPQETSEGNFDGSPPDQTRPDLNKPDHSKDSSSGESPLTRRTGERSAVISVKGDWPSVEALVALYNEATPDECPAVQELSEARVKKARKYLRLFPKREFWEQVFRQIHHNRFLRGLQPSPDHQSFRADFDWLLSVGKDGTENCVKVHDGKYVT
jgi:hypothetical protein